MQRSWTCYSFWHIKFVLRCMTSRVGYLLGFRFGITFSLLIIQTQLTQYMLKCLSHKEQQSLNHGVSQLRQAVTTKIFVRCRKNLLNIYTRLFKTTILQLWEISARFTVTATINYLCVDSAERCKQLAKHAIRISINPGILHGLQHTTCTILCLYYKGKK